MNHPRSLRKRAFPASGTIHAYSFPSAQVTHAERIAEILLGIGAVRLSPTDPFTWTSGIKSPIYCDNRMLYSHPAERGDVVEALTAQVRNLPAQPDVVAGTATAAIGWAALVADRLNLPFVYVRAKAKEHGAKKRIEGDLKKEQHVVVVEDLISTAGSSISTVQALREEGSAVVTDIVSIFSYEFAQATHDASEASVALHPLATITQLLAVAQAKGRLTEEEAGMVQEFIKNPAEWRGKE